MPMLRQDPPSKTLRFDVRKGPVVAFAIFAGIFGPAILWLAIHLAAHPEIQLRGRGAALMNLLPNPARVGIFAVLGAWLTVFAFAAAARALTFLGALVIRADGILFESGIGTWTAPWRDIRTVKILNKKVVVIERNQPAAPNPWFIALWRHMRYGCDPNSKRLSLARMPAAGGKAISPEDLVRIIENYRRPAPGTPRQSTRPDRFFSSKAV
jgi:hypothetical protein